MSERTIDVSTLIDTLDEYLIVDVRSPSEYAHSRIQGSISLPLFTDSQRAEIGTLYKQRGREQAMLHALDYYSPNMKTIITGLELELKRSFKENGVEKKVVVHCWRGGMRSGVVSWMLELFGHRVHKLSGGYKSYRRWSIQKLEESYPIVILGGRTGAAKTDVLSELKLLGEQTIDLEALAHHKGSAFGGIDQSEPPTQEQFENEVALQLHRCDVTKKIWLEDESQRIGSVSIHNNIWKQMRDTTVYYLDVPFDLRLEYLVKTYGTLPLNDLVESTVRIRKKLGGLQMQQAVDHLDKKNFHEAFNILLKYYDKAYDEATSKRLPQNITRIPTNTIDAKHNSHLIVNTIKA